MSNFYAILLLIPSSFTGQISGQDFKNMAASGKVLFEKQALDTTI